MKVDNADYASTEAQMQQPLTRKGSEHLYTYADVNKTSAVKSAEAQPSSIRKGSDHVYNYADVNNLASAESTPSKPDTDENQEGWEENVAYVGSDFNPNHAQHSVGDDKPLDNRSNHKPSEYSYAYADATHAPGRKGSDHVYTYADVKNVSAPSDAKPLTGEAENEPYYLQIFADSTSEENASRDLNGPHDGNEEGEGWMENSIYVQGSDN